MQPSIDSVALHLQGSGGVHEDEVMGVGLDASLAAEEAAEQAVLVQLRDRAACLEEDLLKRAMDGLNPNSKVAQHRQDLKRLQASIFPVIGQLGRLAGHAGSHQHTYIISRECDGCWCSLPLCLDRGLSMAITLKYHMYTFCILYNFNLKNTTYEGVTGGLLGCRQPIE